MTDASESLAGQVAVVLGGGGEDHPRPSIGKAICMVFARAGAHVVVVDASATAAGQTCAALERLGGHGEAQVCDVRDDDALTGVLRSVGSRLGRIDVLHANVGLGRAGPSEETTPADWRRISDANLTSLHVATQGVLPAMRAQGSGTILVTSSIAGIRDVGYPHLAYGATKAAAIQFVRLLASEHAACGIRANTIVAGLIDTPRIERTLATSYGDRTIEEARRARARQCPMGRMGRAEDVAEAALFLASSRAAYITGTELVVDGGLAATVRPPVF